MATVGQRPDIEGKIALISDRIVRARMAKKNSAILLSRVRNVAAVAGSTLTTVGLTNPLLSLLSGKGDETVNYVFSASWYGLPKVFSFVGVGIFILTAMALAFYRKGNVEEKAIQSLGLVEAFERLEVVFENSLEQDEPIQQLNAVYNQAQALETSNFKSMPKRDNFKSAIDQYAQKTVNEYCRWWKDAAPTLERREK